MLNVCNFISNLNKVTQILLISGDDEFLKYDTSSIYLEYCKKLGYSSRRLELKSSSDWAVLPTLIEQNSFFPEKKLLICQLNQKSINQNIDTKFSSFLSTIPDHIRIIFIANKISASLKKTKIYSLMSDLSIWPLKPNELKLWTNNQAKFLNLKLEPAQTEQLIRHANFNALEVKNSLAILASGKLEFNSVFSVSSQSSLDIWQLLDYAMIGDKIKVVEICRKVHTSEIISILTACIYCLKNALKIEKLIQSGSNLDSACRAIIKWPKQQMKYKQLMQRRKNWQEIINKAIQLEQNLKGINPKVPVKVQLIKLLTQIAW